MTATVLATPFGRGLLIAADERGIGTCRWVPGRSGGRRTRVASPLLAEACRQAEAYFDRRLRRFDVPLSLEGTALQLASWSAVAQLAAGETISYADVARAIGRPGAHRAVAHAMALAPLALFVPAHRVLASGGRLRGAGPHSMRRKLLLFEGVAVRA